MRDASLRRSLPGGAGSEKLVENRESDAGQGLVALSVTCGLGHPGAAVPAQEKRQRVVIFRFWRRLQPRPRVGRKAERGAAELHLLRGLTHNRERRILGWPAVVAFHQHRAFPNEARGLAMKRPGDRHAL